MRNWAFKQHFAEPQKMRPKSFGVKALAIAIAAMGIFIAVKDGYAQSLPDELDYLIRTNPQIEAQRAILRRAQESVRTARAGFYPTVSTSGSLGNEQTSNPTTRPLNQDNDWLPFRALGIEIRQNIFDGKFNFNSVDSALMARDSVAFVLNSTVQTVMLQGATVYLEVLRLNELIRVARARERTIREQLELETARVERGAGIEVDVLQNKSRLQLAIEARVDLEGQLRQTVAQYIQTFERDPDVTRMRLAPPPLALVPATLEEAMFTAQQENPQLASRALLTRAARFTVEAQKSGYFPRFDAVARYDAELNVSATRDHAKKAAILIEMSWDMFSGFLTQSNVAAAQETLIEQFAINDTTERDVERQVRQSWSKLENTRVRKELLLNAVSIAQEVFAARQRLRESGKETALNVLDAENEVFQAEQNLIRADYDSRIAVFELAAAMGVLSPDLLGIQTPVIQNSEMFFVDEGEVRDPEPIAEVETYWEQVQSQRNSPVGASPESTRPSASPAAPAQDVAPSALPEPESQESRSDNEPGEDELLELSTPVDLESNAGTEGDLADSGSTAAERTSANNPLIELIEGIFGGAETAPARDTQTAQSIPVSPVAIQDTVPVASDAVESVVGDAAPMAASAQSESTVLPSNFVDQVTTALDTDRENIRYLREGSEGVSVPQAALATQQEQPAMHPQTDAQPVPYVEVASVPSEQFFEVPGTTLFSGEDQGPQMSTAPR